MMQSRIRGRSHRFGLGLLARLLMLGLVLALGLTLGVGVPGAEAATAEPCAGMMDHAPMAHAKTAHAKMAKGGEASSSRDAAHGDLCCLFHCVPVAPLPRAGAPRRAVSSDALPLVLSVLVQGVTPPVGTPPPRAR